MARLIYTANMSLDGYTEDRDGHFDWTAPSEEYFSFITNLIRSEGTHLYGRRMYESMRVWETDPTLADQSALMRDFAEVWQAADKIVYSRTLETVSTRKTKIEQSFDPESIRQLKESVKQDIHIGGAEIAAEAFQSGLIDECHLFIMPVIVGGGKQCLPGNVRLALELMDEHRFDNGTVFLSYRVKPGRAA
jgi:dihydrofolate reductase